MGDGDVRRRAGLLAVVVAAAGLGAGLVAQATSTRPEPPVVADPAPSEPAGVPKAGPDATPDAQPSPEPGSGTPAPVVGAADLDMAVLVVDVVGDGGELGARQLEPDGSERAIGLEGATLDEFGAFPRVFADGDGGAVWQASGRTGSSPIVRTGADGTTTVLVEGTEDHSESRWLVGVDVFTEPARVLYERRSGTTPDDATGDLLSIGVDGGDPHVLIPDISGWESGVGEAVAREDRVLYSFGAEGWHGAFIGGPVGDPVMVLDGGESTGEYAQGVGLSSDVAAILVERAAGFPDVPEASLLLLDTSELRQVAEVAVPLLLGEEDSWLTVRGLSMTGRFILVNRYAEGAWFRPLVYDLEARTWSVFEVPGQARFAMPTGS